MKKEWAPQLLSVVRIVLAYLLIQASTIKLFGFPAVIFCFLFLYISAAGPGPWSLDARFRSAE